MGVVGADVERIQRSKARISAIGSYVPERVMTNFDLEQMVGTSDAWIVQRTGIKERRIAEANEFTSDLCVQAATDLKARFPGALDDLDMVIVCTFTPDFSTPSVSARVQQRLGLRQCGTLDINSACAGFTYGLHVANGLVTAGLHKKVLVIAGETMSKIVDYTDRTTCVLFGDGAGAVVVEYDAEAPSFLAHHMGTQGDDGINLYCAHLSQEMDGAVLDSDRFLVQNGREVYKWAVTVIPQGVEALMAQSGYCTSDVTWFIPHSSNLRMIQTISEKCDVPSDRMLNSLVYYGNTSSATIPLALDKGVKEGHVKAGDVLMLYGFGGGLTHCGLLLEWGLTEAPLPVI
jgi:3-oxoacyl-[acyl-carrier-protein] synthase-3